jgi:hypothetical protein
MHDYRKFKVSVNGQRQREDRSHSPPFRQPAFPNVFEGSYVKSRLTGNAATCGVRRGAGYAERS